MRREKPPVKTVLCGLQGLPDVASGFLDACFDRAAKLSRFTVSHVDTPGAGAVLGSEAKILRWPQNRIA